MVLCYAISFCLCLKRKLQLEPVQNQWSLGSMHRLKQFSFFLQTASSWSAKILFSSFKVQVLERDLRNSGYAKRFERQSLEDNLLIRYSDSIKYQENVFTVLCAL